MLPLCSDANIQGLCLWNERPLTRLLLVSNFVCIILLITIYSFLIQSKNFNSSSTIEKKENLDHTVPQKVAKFNLSNRIVHFTILNIYSDGNSTPSLYIENNFTVLLSLSIYMYIQLLLFSSKC